MNDFPELLVAEHLANPADARLVQAFHDWNAAPLLPWPRLDDITRARLEAAACHAPGRLAEVFPHVPHFLDPAAARVARVQARLIGAAA